MTATQWLKRLNRHLAPQGERIVRCPANDPRWERLGDYFIENIKTGRVPLAFVTLRQVGTPLIRTQIEWRREMRERRERRKNKLRTK